MDEPTNERRLETVNMQIDAIKGLLMELEGRRRDIQYEIDETAYYAKMETAGYGYEFPYDMPLNCTPEFIKLVYERLDAMPFEAEDTVCIDNYNPTDDTFTVRGYYTSVSGVSKVMVRDMLTAWRKDMEAIGDMYPPDDQQPAAPREG